MKNNSPIFAEENHDGVPGAELLTLNTEAESTLGNKMAGKNPAQNPF